MNNKQEKNHITRKVLGKIKKGKIKMRPKIHFIFGTALLMLGVLVLVFFIPYLVSLIIFSLRVSGVLFLPKFGFSGTRTLLSSLPWPLILITMLLIVLLERFAQKFTFAYRKPAIYSLIAIIVIVFMGSFLIGETSFHSNLFWKSQERVLPVIGAVYRDFGSRKIDDMYHGIIMEVINDGFELETLCGDVFAVAINPKTSFMPDTEFQKGDRVVVLGNISSGAIQALDIRKVEQDSNLFSPQQGCGNRFFKE